MVFSPKAKQLSLAASASLIPNNLATLCTPDSTAFYYVHNAAVWQTMVVGDKEEHKLMCMLDELAAVHQVAIVHRAVSGADEDILVVAGLDCIEFHTLTGRELATYQPGETSSDEEPDWFRGIAAMAGLILVGNSKGQVLAFDAHTLQLEHCHTVAKTPITTLGTSDKVVAVAEESGCVSVFSMDLAFHHHLISEPTDVPCYTLRISNNRLLCGMEDGTIRIFCFDTYTELAVVHGHARSVYAIDVNSDGTLVTSAGLDCKAQVWRIGAPKTTDTPLRVELAFTATIKDRMLVGAAFLGDKRLAISCFDSYKLVVFTKL